jgi:hypothetical protein
MSCAAQAAGWRRPDRRTTRKAAKAVLRTVLRWCSRRPVATGPESTAASGGAPCLDGQFGAWVLLAKKAVGWLSHAQAFSSFTAASYFGGNCNITERPYVPLHDHKRSFPGKNHLGIGFKNLAQKVL